MAMTAEGLLCRQYLGWNRNDERLVKGTGVLLENPIDADSPNVYYWYYATQVLHHMGGQSWNDWNNVMRDVIPRLQETEGKERGSWELQRDPWADGAGRLFSTCLSLYMLEVYYRHLPLYDQIKFD
jgi:hypothetical protein